MGVHSQIESPKELAKFHRGDTRVDTDTLRRIVDGEVLDVEELLEPLQSTQSLELPLRARLGIITTERGSTAVVEALKPVFWPGTQYRRHRHHESRAMAWLLLPLVPWIAARRQVAKLDLGQVRWLLRVTWTKLLRIIARYRVARHKTEWGLVVKRKLAVMWSRRAFALGCGMAAFSLVSMLVILTTPWFTPGIVIGSAFGMVMAYGASVMLDTIAEQADEVHYRLAAARAGHSPGDEWWAVTQRMPSAPGKHRAANPVEDMATEEPAE